VLIVDNDPRIPNLIILKVFQEHKPIIDDVSFDVKYDGWI